MNKLKDLSGKVFRISLDGVYFSGNLEFTNDEKDSTELLKKKIESSIFTLSTIFGLKEQHLYQQKNGFSLEDTRGSGVFIRLSQQASNLNINIQFKGFFFTFPSAWIDMKCYMLEVIREFKTFFRPTLIDIAQDISLKTFEILPFPSKTNIEKGLIYKFKYQISQYSEKIENNDILHTGFVINNTRFKIKLYNKIRENEKSKNQQKKAYYTSYYSDFSDVSRLELTLKQESCKLFWESIYDIEIDQELFSLQLLQYFGQKHSARVRPFNSRDKDTSRWPILSNWQYLFNRLDEKKLINKETTNDYIFLRSNLTKEKIISDFVELMNNDKSASINEMVTILKSTYKDVLKIIDSKKSRRRFTKNYFEKLRSEVLLKTSLTPGVRRSGGDTITSPPNSIMNIKSNTYQEQGSSYVQ